MKYTVSNIPYYKSLGISADSVKSSHDLKMFPVITKKDIQDNKDAFLLPTAQREDLYVSRTSGTTCEPTVTYFDRDSWLFGKYALKIRRLLGVSNPLFKRLLIITEQNNQDSASLKNPMVTAAKFLCVVKYQSLYEEIDDHIALILQYKPDILYAFPSYLSEVSNRFTGRELECPKIPVIFTSSELLTPKCKRQIESSFQGRIYDIYGSTEFKEIAWQCTHGRYHINCENIYLETLADNTISVDEANRLLVTSLTNYAMPLVRFDIGDTGNVASGRCDCGRFLPYLEKLHGRETEYILLASGRTVSPYILTMAIEEFPAIRKYQIVQTGPLEFRIDVVCYDNELPYSAAHNLPIELKRLLGERVTITVNKVNDISRLRGEKYQIVVHND